MLGHNFCRSDGRLVKLSLFSTLLEKSPRTSIYFATFEKKTEVRSPLSTQSKFVVFGKYTDIIPKTKKFGCVGRGDLTFLFFSKVVKYSRVTYIYVRSRAKYLIFRTTTSKINTLRKPLMQQKYHFIHEM